MSDFCCVCEKEISENEPRIPMENGGTLCEKCWIKFQGNTETTVYLEEFCEDYSDDDESLERDYKKEQSSKIVIKSKFWFLVGLIGLGAGIFPLIVPGYTFWGIVIVGVSIFAICYRFNASEKVSRDTYEKMLFARECSALCSKSEKYLSELEEDSDYLVLRELYSYLPVLYNQYGTEILHTPLQLTKPVSPYTAGLLGTQVGGVVVGMLAAQNAIEKQKAYEQNVQEVIIAKLNTGNALDKLKYCYASIEAIINNNTITKKDWEREKELIQEELDEDYSISLFL